MEKFSIVNIIFLIIGISSALFGICAISIKKIAKEVEIKLAENIKKEIVNLVKHHSL